MREYFKLNLNNCSYWQSENINGNIVYNKNKHNTKSNDLLNSIYLVRLSSNKLMEIDSKKIIEIEDNNIIKPLGVDIQLSNFSPCSFNDVIKAYRRIQLLGLTSEYRKTINELFVKSELCEIANKKKEIKLGLLKRY